MRASDLPEDEQAAHYERVRDALERADAMLDTLAGRTDSGIEERWVAPISAQAPEPAPVRPRGPATVARDWDAERRWVEGIIDRKLHAFAGIIGGAEGEFAKEERAQMRRELEERIGRSDAATVDLLLQIERRLADLEQRVVMKPPPKPKLVDENAA